MRLSLHSAPVVAFGLLASTSIGSPVRAGEAFEARIIHVADRCSEYGLGYVDLGRGVCGQTHVRVDSGLRKANNNNAWTSSGTSSATLRSDGIGMLPGMGASSHLRVRNNLETYSPFR